MGLQIRLLVRTFSLEQQDRACWFDGLTIRNGGTDQSPLIGTYCGDRRGEEFNGTISSGHQLYLHFYSDGTGSERGFELEWDASTTGCGGILTAPYGTIISPNYPLAYGHNGSCSWRIIVSQGSTVRITLTSLHLGEDGDRCRHDYLDVYDGEDAGGHRIGRFCGRPVAPALVYTTTTTTTNHAYLRLQSTDTYQGEGGFRLDYGLVCRQNNITTGRHRGVLESPNFPDRYPSGLDCQWSFVVPRGNRIRLEFPFFAIESLYSEATGSTESQHCPYDYLEVRQREPSSSSPVDPMPVTRRYCTAPPRTFVSLGNTIEVLFHSASSSSNSSTVSTGERFGFRLEWSIEGCGGLLDNHRNPRYAQEFHSPGYPHSYPRDTECVWEIATEPGYRIMLSFEELRLLGDAGCRSDGVMVANDAAFRQLITTICHERTEAPLQVVSTGHQLYVKFWSSESPVASRGFRARYIAESAACGGTYILHRGVITSPNYPAPYPVNVTCEWLILTELSHTLQLTFEDLVLEPSDNCTNDAVMVYDGIVPESEHLLLVACGTGSTSTTSVSSIQHGLLVTFRSNELYSYKGFRASYVTNCGAQIVAKRPGTVKLDTAHMLVATRECSWVLTAPEETERITLSFVHVSIGDHETADSRCNVSMEVLDGDASTSGAVRYTGCGYHVPAAIVSSGNALTVRIRSGDVSLTELNNLFLEFSYTTLENACGGRLDALTGLFASPNYPRSYPANVECVWMVRASPGNRIRLEIRQLDIVPTEGCNGDYLEVRESDVSGRLLGDFCGTVQPEGNLSAVGGMWIKFRSSGPTVANGFLAHYAYESLNELDGSDGTITSPLYPRSYYALRRVGWRVSVPEGSGVAISFNQFAIDHSSDLPDLCDGSLRIYDGYDDEAPVLLTACGYVKPEPLTSSTNVVYIELDHRHARGPSNFSLHWQQRVLVAVSQQPTSTACDNGHQRLISLDAVGIAYNVTSPGFPYGYAPDLACSWIMQSAIASYHPVLRLVVVDLEETSECLADYVEVASSSDLAQWQPFGRICRYGENREGSETTAQDTFAGKPHLRLSFRTDYYHNRTGFAATVQLACGSYLTAPNGVIELEPEDQNRASGTPWALGGCSWNVSVRAGRQIEFEQLTLSEGTVTIRNGIDERAPVIGVYGGGTEKLSPGLLHTTGNRAFVHYQLPGAPEGGSRRVEFRLLYRELSLECGDTVWLDRHYNTTTLQTPNYPSAPPPFLDCVWKIMVAAGHLLRLDLLDVDSFLYRQECDHRYLQVLDGPTDRGPELLNTCHSFPSAARTLYSTTDGMRLRYFVERQPDDRQPKPLQFRVSLVNCGRSSYSARGTITSAHYPLPGAYPAPAECQYNINPPTLAPLQLTFTDLHLPGNPAHHQRGCTDTDSVRLYGIMWGSNGSVQLPLGTFCGTTVPPAPIESPTAHVLVSFRTLQSNHSATEYRGFRLTYRTKPNNCVHRIEAPSGVVANPGYDTQLAPQKHCVWEITVPVGRRVKIEFLDLDPTLARTEDHRLVMFYDGFTMSKRNRDYVRIPYGIPASDGGLPAPIYTSSNELAIRYFSLRDIIGRGIFKVRFSSDEATVCVGNLNGPGGTIETPANASTLVCSYGRTDRTLGSSDRGTLALSFREVVVKGPFDGASCIEIVGASGKSLLRKLCSSSSRKQVILSPFADTAITLMRGRVEGERLGFKMDYRVHECGGRYAGARGGGAPTNISHSSSSSTGEHRCGWQVLYPVGTLVEIRVVRFDLRLPCAEEYLVLYNGPLPTSPRIGRYCKDAPIVERTIATHRHELYVEYHAAGPTAGSFELQLGGKPFGCGGTLHSGTPTFGSPIMSDASNRTTTYPPNVECVWLLQTQLGQQIGVSFVERFSIEKSPDCTKDYLELFDQPVRGEWISLGRVCGKTPIPGVFNSTGPTLKVVFRTDNATESDGFTIRWDVNCGGVFYAEEEPQLIMSPNFPEPYSPNQHCSYTIVASNGTDRHIELSFGSFQLAAISPVQSCQSTDNLTLYRRDEQSPDPNAWQTAGTYCGAVGPMSTFRALDRARVVFRSDRSREGPGFVFEFQLGSCGGNVTGSQRIQSPVSGPLPEGMSHRAGSPLHCRWYLAIPPGRKVTVRFERLDLRHSTDCREDAIEVYRGLELTRSNRLAVLCGNLTGHAPAVPISGSHGIISFRMGPQQQQQQNRKSSSKSSKSVPPLVALILYGPDCDRSITLDDRSPRYELRVEGGGEVQDCHYTFEAPTGYTVLVTFEHFQLNTARNGTASCSDDYVELHDGLSALAPLLGRYCGTRAPSARASSGPWLHLRYVTDSALRDMRLEATITMEPSLCGSLEHDLTSGGEVIVSAPAPANTDHPASIQRCLWVFRAAPDHQIELQFLKFELTSKGEDADGCINYIGIRDSTHQPIIYEGLGETLVYHGRNTSFPRFSHGISYPTAYHKYCGGSYVPSPYHSLTNEVFVELQRESSKASGSAVLSVRQSGACDQHYTGLQGRIMRTTVPVRGERPCTITIEVPENYTVAVYFNRFKLEQAVAHECAAKNAGVRVYNGTSERAEHLLAVYCGAVTPNPIFATGQALRFVLPDADNAASLLLDATYVANNWGPGCGGVLYNYGGVLTSPFYPASNNRTPVNCWWMVTVPDNLVVALHFDVFELGSDSSCTTDYLKVTEYIEMEDGALGMDHSIVFCDDNYPGSYVLKTNEVRLFYRRSSRFDGVGFMLRFMAVEPDSFQRRG
ncbi:hypothetical protein AND_001841 [Anopheles darlingi]|uniref:CUB domain-containing protein n=1 Tax=Anopheles darlingi TaxID=43151 RepID=W5JPQ0_ANODA|nr:hypothetical protein AND_001841 [Anopheles darlingi]